MNPLRRGFLPGCAKSPNRTSNGPAEVAPGLARAGPGHPSDRKYLEKTALSTLASRVLRDSPSRACGEKGRVVMVAVRRGVLAVVSFALVGCASGSLGSGGDAGPGAPSEITLSVVDETFLATIHDTVRPTEGRRFLAFEVSLQNGSANSVPIGFQHFQMDTDAALELRPATATAFVKEPCSADVGVAAGGTYRCNVVFEVPVGQHPTTLHYADERGHSAATEVPEFPPSSACVLRQCHVSHGGAACTACLRAKCVAEDSAEFYACFCRDPQRSDEERCACFESSSGACRAANAAANACAAQCASVCDAAECPPN